MPFSSRCAFLPHAISWHRRANFREGIYMVSFAGSRQATGVSQAMAQHQAIMRGGWGLHHSNEQARNSRSNRRTSRGAARTLITFAAGMCFLLFVGAKRA